MQQSIEQVKRKDNRGTKIPGQGGHGAPSLDNPRRCQAKKSSGKPCRFWARKGSSYCMRHGGNRRQKFKITDNKYLGRRYKKIGRTLGELLDAQLSVSPSQQLELYEELAAMRVHAEQSMRMFEAALDLPDSDTKQTTIAQAGEYMTSVLHSVRLMAEGAARIEASSRDKFSVHNLAFVVNRVVSIVHDVLSVMPEGEEAAEKIEESIRQHVTLIQSVQGTTLTPDEDVAAMDETVIG